MNKLLLIVTLGVTLMGCQVEVWQLNQAEIICKERGGINYITRLTLNSTLVTCMDGYVASLEKTYE